MQGIPIVIASNLSKRFDIYENPRDRLWDFIAPRRSSKRTEFWALRNVSFVINKGETVGIVGCNGSGKSTLLQLVCEITRPTEGEVKVFGRVAALLELGSGFNPQFSGRENVFLYAAVLGMSMSEVTTRFADIARFADIGRFIDYPLSTYSSGMIVRLAFATAIHVSPDLLVIDEALAVGDTAFQQKCLTQIRKMQKAGVSILLVTHSNNTVVEYCDRALYVQHGCLVADGTTAEIVKKYTADIVNDEIVAIDHASRIKISDPPPLLILIDSSKSYKPDVEITSVELRDSLSQIATTYRYGDRITIRIRIKAHRDFINPCCGVQISSVDGIVLWSCTTQSADLELKDISLGDEHFDWGITANFSGNRYIVSVGIGAIVDGEYKRVHRLEYATHFDVLPQAKSGSGWLAPLPTFSRQKL
jgi:lipopolysaccharide transport system ATP-binding protein